MNISIKMYCKDCLDYDTQGCFDGVYEYVTDNQGNVLVLHNLTDVIEHALLLEKQCDNGLWEYYIEDQDTDDIVYSSEYDMYFVEDLKL